MGGLAEWKVGRVGIKGVGGEIGRDEGYAARFPGALRIENILHPTDSLFPLRPPHLLLLHHPPFGPPRPSVYEDP